MRRANVFSARPPLQHPEAMLPLASGEQPRLLSRAEVEAVAAEKETVIQAAREKYSQHYGLSWTAEAPQKGQPR
jgi:hypothetical protein